MMKSLMKKIFYTIFALCAIAVFAVSCEKESEIINNETLKPVVNPNIPTEIVAVINPEDSQTKTQYEGNVTFGWTNGDQVRMPVVKRTAGTITDCNYYTFSTSAVSGSSSATFIINGGSANMESYDPNPGLADGTWTSMGYLVYPASLVNYKAYYGSKPGLTLPSTIIYNASNPLDGGVVPLIGRKDGETYKFSTAVGIIKLTLSNAPSAATKIRLTSAANDLAGDFVPTDVDATVSQLQLPATAWGEKTLTINSLSLTAGETYEFYFPVPVGTYAANDLSISILDSNDLPLLEKTIAKSLTINRNEVLSIPTLLYHRVYVDGSLSAPVLHTVKPSTANTIRVCVSTERLTSANYSKSNWKEGNRFSASTSYNILSLGGPGGSDVLSSGGAGMYYLQYIVCSTATQPDALSDANVMIYGSVPFYYAPAANKIPVESSWLDVPYISASEGKDKGYLVDGTANYWHSPYGAEDPARNATYGQIISVDLNEGSLVTDGNFYFSFETRSGAVNDHAKAINVYVSNVPWDDAGFDAGKVLVGSTANALEGINPYDGVWIKTPIDCTGTGTYRYITVSILSNSTGNDLRTSGCTHMAEIEFYDKM